MTEQIDVETFHSRVLSFREKMGRNDLTGEQRKSLFKMLTLSYLRLRPTKAELDRCAVIFEATVEEYVMRMRMLGETL